GPPVLRPRRRARLSRPWAAARRRDRPWARLLDGGPLHRGQADANERMVCGRVAGGAGGADPLEALLEEGGILLADGVEHGRPRGPEEEILGAGAPGGLALEPEAQCLLARHRHVGGVLPVDLRVAEVELAVAVGDLGHRGLEAAEL